MLHSLEIQDFVLIEHLEVVFERGMIAVTGETGSGKSIFVDAINLLSGKRADYSKVRQGATKAVVEGVFVSVPQAVITQLQEEDLWEEGQEECLIRREISTSGKSRAFVNDTPVSLTLLSSIAPFLVDVHSQHQNLLIKENLFQTQVLDASLSSAEIKDAYHSAFVNFTQEKRAFEKLTQEIQEAQEKEEFNRFRLQELEQFVMVAESEEELEREARYLDHIQEIKEALDGADQQLNGKHSASQGVASALRRLNSIEDFHTSIGEWAERLASVQIEIEDIGREIAMMNDATEPDPKRQEEVFHCINSLNGLLNKYHLRSYEELLQEKKRLAQSVAQFSNAELYLSQQKTKLDEARRALMLQAEKLSAARLSAARVVSEEITHKLQQLEMPHVRFEVQVSPLSLPTASGMDDVVFLFSAHRDMSLRPVGEIASGGEISRLMLSIKSLVRSQDFSPTMVFDEVDTGISGVVAQRVGEILREIAQDKQIFVITHLPQIAAQASSHFEIHKIEEEGRTYTHITPLDREARIREIARLQSGEPITSVALAAAQALLEK